MTGPGRVAWVREPARGARRATCPDASPGQPVIAVLPFSAITANDDSEFFAAGVHDDLLTQLSKLQSLRVTSRTSVLEYKDLARNPRELAPDFASGPGLAGGFQPAPFGWIVAACLRGRAIV